jgi:poly(A) polymerase
MDDERAISTKPPCSRDDALEVLKRLRRAGHVAYFAGGCVRDLLMSISPKDYDVATNAPPQRVRELFSNTQAVGQAFGVILVKHGPSTVEVATFRTEGIYSDGRRPDSVAFTSAQHDAQRRDFTINGLFLDPLENPPTGKVIDYVNGQQDLRNRVLRAIGDPHKRFAEDHLRLLRAVRFAARLGFTVESSTAHAIRTNAAKLKGISPERIADELRMMLTPATRRQAWALLWEYGLIPVIFRFLPPRDAQSFNAGDSLFTRVAPQRPITFSLGLAAAVLDYRLNDPNHLLALLSRPEIARVGRAMRDALKISNEELDAMTGILSPLTGLLAPAPPALAAKKRFLALATAGDTRLLLRALASHGLFPQRIEELESEFKELSKTEVAPAPLITGDDLVAAGFLPGPAFKRILDTAYDAQLEGNIATREDAMQLARDTKT